MEQRVYSSVKLRSVEPKDAQKLGTRHASLSTCLSRGLSGRVCSMQPAYGGGPVLDAASQCSSYPEDGPRGHSNGKPVSLAEQDSSAEDEAKRGIYNTSEKVSVLHSTNYSMILYNAMVSDAGRQAGI
jgi:hypothetical protein